VDLNITKIQDFLSRRRIAIVGVSHRSKDFSRLIFRAFRERNFDVVPVNPAATTIEGIPCFPAVQEVQPPPETALLMTSPEISEQIVKDCVAAGIRHIWIYRRSPNAEAWCATRGIEVIAGECPMMFLKGVGWIHRVHRWFRVRKSST
jgi:predicted CoA-binding protein